MNEPDNGGPAFPLSRAATRWIADSWDDGVFKAGHNELDPAKCGLSLRDYFATHVQVEDMPNRLVFLLMGTEIPQDELERAKWIAEAEGRYRYFKADAMLRARKA